MKKMSGKQNYRSIINGVPIGAVFFLPLLAQAHPGTLGHTHGFVDGFAHPLTGSDHFCAMLAVGLWAVQRGGSAMWFLPLMFVSLMVVGGSIGMAGIPMGFVEPGIAASVLVFGLLVLSAIRLPLAASAILTGGFALFHGHAHGADMPGTASALSYGAGFALATMALHLLGMSWGLLARNFASTKWIRIAGGAVAVCGLYFCLSL